MPPLARAPSTTWTTLSQIASALCSTHPGRGKICSNSSCASATIRPSWSKMMQRLDVVPWSMAATYCCCCSVTVAPRYLFVLSPLLGSVAESTASEHAVGHQCGEHTADDRADDRHPGI